jgi:hypothetical protein
MERRKEHRGCVLTWQEPPLWTVSVTSDRRDVQGKVGGGAAVISGHSREDAITKAKAFVDRLLLAPEDTH